jgi:homoserine/homoserine lactone efflux protein
MIDPSLLLAFIAAVTVLMLIPGPNVALIIANSVSYGAKYGLLTVAGTASAMVVQLGLTAAGMTELLGSLGAWFEWVRWVGVAYLIYLGIAQWRAPAVDLTQTRPEPKSASAIFVRALLVSLTNPKTLLFYSAFFPQFIRTDRAVGAQVAVLSTVFELLPVWWTLS